MSNRVCQFCDEPLFRRKTERWGDFQSRRFCNTTCRTNWRPPKPQTELVKRRSRALVAAMQQAKASGIPLEEVPQDVGYKNAASLARVLHRYGHHDLARPFDRIGWHERKVAA